MEKLNLSSTETSSNIVDAATTVPETSADDAPSRDIDPTEKPDSTKKIESFDINNLTAENIEYMNHVIQDIFRENLPVRAELIDGIPDRMNIVGNDEFLRTLKEEKEDADMDLGYYSLKQNKMFVNLSKHHTTGGLFLTMFHESLHFTSIQSGAGLTGDFCLPDIEGQEDADELYKELDDGVQTMVEGITQNFAQAYVIGEMKFDTSPEMFGYEPECLITRTILEPFSAEEKQRIYFDTPLELMRVHIEDAFAEDYDVDEPTGVFADCFVEVSRTKKQLEEALDSWRKDRNPDTVESILDNVRRAVDFYIASKNKS